MGGVLGGFGMGLELGLGEMEESMHSVPQSGTLVLPEGEMGVAWGRAVGRDRGGEGAGHEEEVQVEEDDGVGRGGQEWMWILGVFIPPHDSVCPKGLVS